MNKEALIYNIALASMVKEAEPPTMSAGPAAWTTRPDFDPVSLAQQGVQGLKGMARQGVQGMQDLIGDQVVDRVPAGMVDMMEAAQPGIRAGIDQTRQGIVDGAKGVANTIGKAVAAVPGPTEGALGMGDLGSPRGLGGFGGTRPNPPIGANAKPDGWVNSPTNWGSDVPAAPWDSVGGGASGGPDGTVDGWSSENADGSTTTWKRPPAR